TTDTDTGDTTGEPGDCYSTLQFFADEVWAPSFSKSCIQCHDPTGIAAEKNAKFLLLPPVYPGFMEANLANIASFAGYEYDDVPLLLAKPLFLTEHEGGKLFAEDDDIYIAIEELLAQMDNPIECPVDTSGAKSFDDVDLMTPAETLRKASLHLVGRLPTVDEYAAVDQDGLDALPALLDAMMTEDAFFERTTDIFNDKFLTDKYANNSTNTAVALLSNNDFPARNDFVNNVNMLPTADRIRINEAVAREPLELINYIIRNDRPFTEIITANYTVFNSDSAMIYGADVSFENPDDKKEFQQGIITVPRGGVDMPFPHAGIITSPMWLNRFPTTPTNIMRHRSRMILDQFLATDVLALASQAIDPDAGSAVFNPTRNNPDCSKCHKLIDPIAGAFQMFDKNDQEKLLDPPQWYPEVFVPGYLNENMPPDQFSYGIQWLAERVAADPRFALAMTYTMFDALTGIKPLHYPTNPDAEFYDAELAAWETQDLILRSIADKFVADNHNIKTVIREIIQTPYFRGKGMLMAPSPARAAEIAELGVGRLSTPELLADKLEAATGYRWIRSDKRDYLGVDYEILYGGHDSDAITERLTTINSVMASVGARMANEHACTITAFDFTRAAEERSLFPMVELTDTPDNGSSQAIKENIQYLHRQILGEDLPIDDPEISRAYLLFADTLDAGLTNIANDAESTSLLSNCRATKDLKTGMDLPGEQQITTDETYVVRAWMAVVTYLLSDYKFLFE
ncbi:MAG: DUF1588 domain-containing protein, partial [Myxococcales bacterium]|nr:DUF1588 domain-containing protein [Myxococcales bacterium]